MRALILVDIQNDFCLGGALAVPNGDEVVAVANTLMPQFDLTILTQDWHPANHGSFASNHDGKNVFDVVDLDGLDQVLWPDHCVEWTKGAEFHRDLDLVRVRIFKKGTDPKIDSYSGFFDNGKRKATGLGKYLKDCGVTEVVICGLATDYCVKWTAIDARDLGFNVTVVTDGCRAVNLAEGDGDRAFEEMAAAGCKLVTSDQLS